MKITLLGSLVAAALALSNGAVRAESLTLSTPDADTSEITLAAKHFAELVKQKTNGDLEIRVFPNGTLYGGDPSAGVKQLAGGSLYGRVRCARSPIRASRSPSRTTSRA